MYKNVSHQLRLVVEAEELSHNKVPPPKTLQ